MNCEYCSKDTHREHTYEFHYRGMGYTMNVYACCEKQARAKLRAELNLKRLPNNFWITKID